MAFADVRGQDHAVGILRRSLSAGRVAHAYLFEGPSGCGKRLAALALIQALFCGASDPCGTCPACRKLAKGVHPDLHLLEPEKGVIKIDPVRELQRELSLRPLEAPRKACIITQADTMNPSSANAFLKTLEEPPGSAVIILLTESVATLLPTILSRCQRLRFGTLDQETITELLTQRGIPRDVARVAASRAGGSMEKGLAIAGEDALGKRRDVVEQVLGLTPQDFAALTTTAERLGDDKEQAREVVEVLTSYYRDLLLHCHGSTDVVNGDLMDLINRSTHLSRRGILERLDSLNRAGYALLRNVNPRLALETLFIALADT